MKIIGGSKAIKDIYHTLERLKISEAKVLIQGENGTGKELIARTIHRDSIRKDKPFVVQNCSAFNDNLLESELFGHEAGSFTGALARKLGLFEIASGGTLFLDEIGDTSLSMQAKLLRVLEDGSFMRVGSTKTLLTDVRIISATNKNLEYLVKRNEFREDLYYRLNTFNIFIPPLRNRKDDIDPLINLFVTEFCKKYGHKIILSKSRSLLRSYHWPGNIRELKNEIEHAFIMAGSSVEITEKHFSANILAKGKSRLHGKLTDAIEILERDFITEGLDRTNWNISLLAKELGISRACLYKKLDRYMIRPYGNGNKLDQNPV